MLNFIKNIFVAIANKRTLLYNESYISFLRNHGYSHEQISEITKIPKNKITAILFKLVKERKISRKTLLKNYDVNYCGKRPV